MKKITMLLFVLAYCSMSAQVEYTFTVLNEAYINLEDSTPLSNGEIWDDPGYIIPLGFDFEIGLLTTDTIVISEFGSGGLVNTDPDIDAEEFGLIVPVFQDLVDRGNNSSTSLSPISFRVDGAAGNRILKLEWNNAGFFNNTNLEDFVNFQLWLYESGNVIEYRYGPNMINNPNESFGGLTGLMIALIPLSPMTEAQGDLEQEAYILEGDPSNPDFVILSTINDINNAGNISVTGAVPDGTVYRFSPEQLSLEDESIVEMNIYPNPTTNFFKIESTVQTYSVHIYNAIGQRLSQTIEPKARYDVSNLPKGIYFVKVFSESGVTTRMLIKS